MLGSRYNDTKERLENRRQSFFSLPPSQQQSLLHSHNHNDPRRIQSTGDTNIACNNSIHTTAASSSSSSSIIDPLQALAPPPPQQQQQQQQQQEEDDSIIRTTSSSVGTTLHGRPYNNNNSNNSNNLTDRTRSLDSGIHKKIMCGTATPTTNDISNNSNNNNHRIGVKEYYNNHYGSTTTTTTDGKKEQQQQQEQRRKRRIQSMRQAPRMGTTSCTDLSNIASTIDEKPLLDVVDRIEDQVEARAYEDLVPLEIKMALENRIFGWSHLTSNILGHIAYPMVTFVITYVVVTQLYLSYHTFKYHHANSNNNNNNNDNDNDDDATTTITTDDDRNDLIVWFHVVRMVISTTVAVNTFRTIRRRRHIWFRAAYGTKEYYNDAARRKHMVHETDQHTLLGRLRNRRTMALQRKVQRRLSKAHKLFQKRQQRVKNEQEKRKSMEMATVQQQQQQQQKEQSSPISSVLPPVSIPEKHAIDDEHNFLCDPSNMEYLFSSPCGSFCGIDFDDIYDHDTNNNNNNHDANNNNNNIDDSNNDDSFSTPTTSDEDDTVESLMTPLSPQSIASSSMEIIPLAQQQQQQQALDPNFASQFEVVPAEQQQRRNKRRKTFHTGPCSKMESIMHDQILLPPILNMPYAHGGFFGAAPFMLANPHWISILRHLMPDVYVEISRRVAYAPASKLIHWAENNPVVAAYGVAHDLEFGGELSNSIGSMDNGSRKASGNSKASGSGSGSSTHQNVKPARRRTTPNLEWDVFLNPDLVWQVESVLAERDNFLSSILPIEHYSFYETHKPLGLSVDDWLTKINEAASESLDKEDAGARIEFTESQRQILKYYADQLEARALLMVDKMLIAHGKLIHLIYEIAGVAKRYNYSRVKRTRRTLGGGIYAQQWMAVYAEALKLGLYDDFDGIASVTSEESRDSAIKKQGAVNGTSLDALASNMCPDYSIAESVALVRKILQRRGDESIDSEYPVGLVLDIKSRYISKRVWACVVDTLRSAGVRVVGLASFTVDEIRGISKFCSDPLMEVIFLHSAGDLQRACHEGKIRYGDKVFFNGGSLLWQGMPGLAETMQLALGFGYDPNHTKRSYRILPFGRTRKMFDAERTTSRSSPGESPDITSSSQWMTEGSTIELYKERYGLSIGLYAQEFAIDDKAAHLMVELVNENPHVYDLGLSWGGVNGITIQGIQPGRFTSTDGLWNQRHMAALWDSNLYPPPMSGSPNATPPPTPKLDKQQ